MLRPVHHTHTHTHTHTHSLGEGTYSRVVAARDMETGEPCAIKIVELDSTAPQTDGEESHVLSAVRHPNMVGVRRILETPSEVCYVTERMQADLYTLLYSRNKLDEANAKAVGVALVRSLGALHSLDIAHRDVKLENILLNTAGEGLSGPVAQVKLADFGYAKYLTAENQPVGTSFYQSPETLLALEHRKKLSAEHAKSADVFALGVLLFYVVCGRPPYVGNSFPVMARHKLFQQMRAPPQPADPRFPPNVTLECREFICGLLAPAAAERPSIQDCAKHVWVAEAMRQEEVDTVGPSSSSSLGVSSSSPALVSCPA